MRTHGCRWLVVVLLVFPALFMLSGCGAGTKPDQTYTVTVPTITSISPTNVNAEAAGFTLTVVGTKFLSGAAVYWNATALATTYVSGNELAAIVPAPKLVASGTASITVVNPSPGGGTSLTQVFTVNRVASRYNHVISLSMTAAGMVWDASRGRIYAALPSSSANANSVVAIDPVTGAAGAAVSVGSNPNLLALSADASYLWVSLDGASAIQRVTLPNLTPEVRIDLPLDSYYGPQVALAMQAAPVDPNTLAVLLSNSGRMSGATGGLAIYDGAVQRPATIPHWATHATWLQWGPDDSTLYGHGSGASDFDVLSVNASGVQTGTHFGYVFPNANQSHYDRSTGLVYADDGRVFDPATGILAGTFDLGLDSSACLPDPVQPVVFFLGHESSLISSYTGFTLRAFDKNTYRLIGSLRISIASGKAVNLIRWGRAGIAFNTVSDLTYGGKATVYFVDGPFIDASAVPDFTSGEEAEVMPVFTAMAPESATVGSSSVTLTISGSHFQAYSTVFWNGQALATTYDSSTQLEAVVPASKLAQLGSATVSVANDGASVALAVNSLAFTVLPVSSGVIVRNLSISDVAWDAHSSRLYAPVRGGDPRYPNSVVAIDPVTGGISKVADVGADPCILRISRDGTLGYIGYMVANLVTQFHVPTLDSMVTWSLGADSFHGPKRAADLQPAPDSAQTTAIVLDTPDSSGNLGVTIFDSGIARPQRPTDSGNAYDSIQWGLTDSVLYAANNEGSGFELSTIGVDATGGTLLRTDRNVLTNYFVKIHFDRGTGYLYCDDGYVTDPATGGRVGNYNASGLLAPDASLNRVFILRSASPVYGNRDYTILSFDQARFTPVSSLTIQNLVGDPVAFIRWGASGLAIVTWNSHAGPTQGPAGMLYILDNPTFAAATQPAQAGVENLTSVDKVFRSNPRRGTRDPRDRP